MRFLRKEDKMDIKIVLGIIVLVAVVVLLVKKGGCCGLTKENKDCCK